MAYTSRHRAPVLALSVGLAGIAVAYGVSVNKLHLLRGGSKAGAALSLSSAGPASVLPSSTQISMPPPAGGKPGGADAWQPTLSVFKGTANLATGNLILRHATSSWRSVGPGVSFVLSFNSQSSVTGVLGPKWTHSYAWKVTGTSPAVVTRGDGRELSFSYSGGAYHAPAGHYEELVHSGSGAWTYTFKNGTVLSFDSSGTLTSLQDRNGNTTTLTYASGNLSSVADQYGRTLTLAYTSGKLSSITDFESKVWAFGYDGSGRLTSVTDPALSSTTYTTQFAYNSANNITSVTDRTNRTWTYTYSGNDFRTCSDPGGGGATTSSVSAMSITPSENPDGGGGGSEQGPTYPSGTVSTVPCQSSTGSSGVYGLNSDGRVTAYRDALNNQTEYTYDSNNNVLTMVEPGSLTTTRIYDSRGNVLTVTDPTSRTTTYTYDSANNVLTEVAPGGATTTNTYDSHGNTLTTTDGTGKTTTFTYNTNGTVASLTDNASHTTTFTYNGVGNLASVSNPLSQTTTFTHTNNRMTSRTDGRGRTVSFTYDDWGRLIGTTNPVTANQSYTYDAEGRMTQSVDATGTRTYSYDSVGRKVGQVDPRGTTTATYTSNRLTSQTDVSGRTITYGYDSRDLLTSVGDGTRSATYTYNALGLVSRVAYSNGVETDYTYDGDGRVTNMTHKWTVAGTVILGYALTYDTTGRLSQVTESPSGDVTTYTWDSADRLLTESRTGTTPYTSTYTYNSVGLRATANLANNGTTVQNASYTYDSANRLSTVSDAVSGSALNGAYTWYADGTLASYPGSGYTRVLDYTEDAQLRSIKKDYGGGTIVDGYSYEYAYDGALRHRVEAGAAEEQWFPCGVACEAGDLTTLDKPVAGSTWAVDTVRLAQFYNGYLSLGGLFGDHARVIDASGAVVYSTTRDMMGVERTATPSVPMPEACTDISFLDDEDVRTQLDQLDLSFAEASSPMAMMKAGPSSGFKCGKKIKKIPWWLFFCRKAVEAYVRSEYCRNCFGLCQLYCDEQELADPSFDSAKCYDECGQRNKKCKGGKKFPPYF